MMFYRWNIYYRVDLNDYDYWMPWRNAQSDINYWLKTKKYKIKKVKWKLIFWKLEFPGWEARSFSPKTNSFWFDYDWWRISTKVIFD